MLKVRFKRLHPDAKMPSYAHPGDAGLDMYTIEDRTLAPGEQAMLKTGIVMEIPEGYVGLVWDKSGLSTKHGLTTIAGVIDAGYRGELAIAIANVGNEPYTFTKGQKVAQVLIQKVEQATFEEANELSESSRGAGGFGSTGTH